MVVGLILFAVALAGLVVLVARLQRELRGVQAELRELRQVVRAGQAESDRVEALIDRADAISTRVDSASKLAYTTFAVPVIKAMSLGAGTKGAVQRLRHRNGNGHRED